MKSYNQDNKETLVEKGRKNALTGILYFIVNIITALILNPILVNYFGSYYFGIWKSIDKFIGFASIADGQGSQALKWTIAHQEASDDFDQKRRYLASSLVVWIVFLPVLIFLIGLLVYLSPFLINGIKNSDIELIYTIVFLLGFNLIITPLFGIPESILVGTNRGHVANYIKIIWLIITFIMTYLIVILEYGLVDLALIIVFVTILRGLHYLFISKKLVHWIGFEKPKKIEVKSFFKFSSWKLIWAFNARFLLSSEIIFLTILVSPKSVSQYIFTSYIPVTGILLSAIVVSAFNPGIGKLIGNQDFEESKTFIMNLREFVISFGVLIGSITLCLNKSFIFLWVGEEFYLGNTINILIVLLMIQLVIIRNEAFLIDLSLDIKKKVLLGILSIILSSIFVVCGYLYTSSIYSIFIGLLLGRMLIAYMFPLITNRMIQNEDNHISIKLVLSSIFILTISFFIGDFQYLRNWFELFIFGMLESILFMFITYYLLLTYDNQVVIKSTIKKLLKRNRSGELT